MKLVKFKRLMFWRQTMANPDTLHQNLKQLERQETTNAKELIRIMRDHQLDTRGRQTMSELLKELDYQLNMAIML